MVISEIERVLEKRKVELAAFLDEDNGISLEKKHQVFGAINEIDVFLKTLSFYRTKEISKEIDDFKLARPQVKKSLFASFFAGIKDKVKKN